MTRLLFLCRANRCRSQMAEGFARHLAGRSLEAWSAGSRPSNEVNPLAIAVMREKGIDLSTCQPKGLHALPDRRFDIVVTLGCGESCAPREAGERLAWAIDDPEGGSLETFRSVRDEIERRVRELLGVG